MLKSYNFVKVRVSPNWYPLQCWQVAEFGQQRKLILRLVKPNIVFSGLILDDNKLYCFDKQSISDTI